MLPSTSSALSCSRTVRWPVSEGRILEFAVLVWLVDNTVAECTLARPIFSAGKKSRESLRDMSAKDASRARIFVI